MSHCVLVCRHDVALCVLTDITLCVHVLKSVCDIQTGRMSATPYSQCVVTYRQAGCGQCVVTYRQAGYGQCVSCDIQTSRIWSVCCDTDTDKQDMVSVLRHTDKQDAVSVL